MYGKSWSLIFVLKYKGLLLFWKDINKHRSIYLVHNSTINHWALCRSWAYGISLFQKAAPGSTLIGEPHEQ